MTIRLLIASRWPLLLLTLALVGAAAWGIPALQFDVSTRSYFVAGDPALAAYDAFQEQFGSDEVVYVLVSVDDPLAEPHLSRLLDLGDELGRLPCVLQVDSPLHTPFGRDEEGTIVAKSVAEAQPTSPAARAEWRERVFSHEPFKDLYLSRDGRHLGFLLTLDPDSLDSSTGPELTDRLQALLQQPPYGEYPSSAVGTVTRGVQSGRILAREVSWATGAGLGVAVVCLLLLLRSLSGLLAILLVVVSTLVATFGLMGHLGYAVTTTSPVLITLLICVGLADAMHLVAGFARARRTGKDRAVALAETVDEVWRPCLLTSLTTSGGFLALCPSQVAPIATLGLFAALGCLLAYLLTFALLPALLLAWPPRVLDPERERDPLLAWLGRTCVERPLWIALPFLLLMGFALAGLPRLYAEEDSLGNLGPEEPLRRDLEFVHERMGGVASFEIVLHPHNPDNEVELAELIHRSAAFETWLRDLHPAVRSVQGLADGVAEMHYLFDGPRTVPADGDTLWQLLFVLESADPDYYERYLMPSRRALRVTMRCNLEGSRVYQQLRDQLESELGARFSDLASGSLTGGVYLLIRTSDYVFDTQIQSFSLAFLVVALLVLLGAGELRLGLLSLVPNLSPVLIVLGFMGWCGIALNISNVLIATVTIGIVVDDTIHMIYSLRRNSRSGVSLAEAVATTLQGSGRAILFTSLVLVLTCFSVAVGSSLRDLREFGLLAGMTFAIALLADLALLPALLRLWSGGSIWSRW